MSEQITKMNKYSNMCIYQIVCKDPKITDCFVGHTNDIKSRNETISKECSNMKCSSYNTPINQFLRNNGGWDNFNIEVLQYVSCSTLFEVLQIKQNNIKACNANLNTIVPSRTKKEWHVDHLAQVTEYQKEYHKQKAIHGKCDCGGSFCYGHKLRHERSMKHQKFINALIV